MTRCNEPARWISEYNGFQACEKHKQEQEPGIPLTSNHAYGPKCDAPIETRARFWERYPSARMNRR